MNRIVVACVSLAAVCLAIGCSDEGDHAGVSTRPDTATEMANDESGSGSIEEVKVRPPLTGDIEAYSDEQLIAMGYPPRVDRKSKMYEAWKRAVTHPAKIAHADTPDLNGARNYPDLGEAPQQNPPIWGGPALAQSGVTYVGYQAEFFVPTVQADGYQSSDSSMWAGVGGASNADPGLIQSGIELAWPANYYAWVEYAPGPWYPVQIGTSNAPVNPGDEILMEAWASDASGNPNVNGGYATYWMEDVNNWALSNATYQAPIDPNTNTTVVFNGLTSEFIIEAKPFYNPGLTDYGSCSSGTVTVMVGEGIDTSGALHNFGTDAWEDFLLLDQNRYEMEEWSLSDYGSTFDQTNWCWLRQE